MNTPQSPKGWVVTTTQHKQRSSTLVRPDTRREGDHEHGFGNGSKADNKSHKQKSEKDTHAATPVEA